MSAHAHKTLSAGVCGQIFIQFLVIMEARHFSSKTWLSVSLKVRDVDPVVDTLYSTGAHIITAFLAMKKAKVRSSLSQLRNKIVLTVEMRSRS